MLLLSFFAFAAAGPVSTDRPSVGASSQTVDESVFQIESGWAQTRLSSEGPHDQYLNLLVRAGIAKNVEARLDAGVDPSDFENYGLAPGLKVTLGAPMSDVTLGVLANIGIPTHGVLFGSSDLLLNHDRGPLGSWLNMGFGYSSSEGGQFVPRAALGVAYSASLSPFVEGAASWVDSTLSQGRALVTRIGFGLIQASERHAIDMAVYQTTRVEGAPILEITFGASTRFGG